ncbi:hypothetical protein [Streptomyces rubiginosohelvolus]
MNQRPYESRPLSVLRPIVSTRSSPAGRPGEDRANRPHTAPAAA